MQDADCTDAVLASPILSRTKTVIDFGRYWAYRSRDRSAEARHSDSAYNLPTGTHPGVRDCRPEVPSAKGTSYAHRNGNVKPLRVLVMAAQQDTKKARPRFLHSYLPYCCRRGRSHPCSSNLV